MCRTIFPLAALATALFSGVPLAAPATPKGAPSPKAPALTLMTDGIEPLKEAFNRDRDAPRLLMLVSPTCPQCRSGASIVQHHVLKFMGDPRLRVYVVWVPIISTDRQPPDASTRSLVPDKRATHFWDGKPVLPVAFQKPLGLAGEHVAWDAYLAYPKGVTWEAEPPRPTYWEHQLTAVKFAPFLDPKSFAKHLREVIDGKAALEPPAADTR